MPFAAAVAGGIASARAPELYGQLVKPSWAPPSWLFGPVWTVLYLLMGIAAFLVWRERDAPAARGSLLSFALHLVLNAAWSWLFFRWQLGAGSFIGIVALWIAIVLVMLRFARVRRLAAALLLPYLLWVTFAAALNFVLWQANPSLLR